MTDYIITVALSIYSSVVYIYSSVLLNILYMMLIEEYMSVTIQIKHPEAVCSVLFILNKSDISI